jgi:hypothetical protein
VMPPAGGAGEAHTQAVEHRHGLHHRDELVVAVAPAAAHGEEEVDLGRDADGDAAAVCGDVPSHADRRSFSTSGTGTAAAAARDVAGEALCPLAA